MLQACHVFLALAKKEVPSTGFPSSFIRGEVSLSFKELFNFYGEFRLPEEKNYHRIVLLWPFICQPLDRVPRIRNEGECDKCDHFVL